MNEEPHIMSTKRLIIGAVLGSIFWVWPVYLWAHTGRMAVGIAGMGAEIIWSAVALSLCLKAAHLYRKLTQ